MGQKIRTITPDKPVSGTSLMRKSVAGRKNQFAQKSGTAEITLVAGAGSTQWLIVSAQFWGNDVPIDSRSDSNYINSDEVIIFPFLDAYIDVLDGNHYIGSSAMTSGQLGVTASLFNYRNPGNNLSGLIGIAFHNFDTSSHTIYCFIDAKYIVTADVNL